MATPSVDDCRLIPLPTIGDERGLISVMEPDGTVPFAIRRVYHLYDVPAGGLRGGHAHRRLEQLLIPVAGSLDVVIDDGRREERVHLDRPDQGLYLPMLIWKRMERFAAATVVVVLASDLYDPDDYIRDYPVFLNHVGG